MSDTFIDENNKTGNSYNLTIDKKYKDETSFEKFIFCKARILKKNHPGIPGKSITSMKKSFWIYPISQKEFSAKEKEEVDLLTTFGLEPSVPKITDKPLDMPLAFLTEYFANYNISSTSIFSFILNKNEEQDKHINIFNSSGVRIFYGCSCTDFELVKYLDKDKQVIYKLEPCQTLFLLECRLPFLSFYRSIIEHLFSIIRLKRLELFSLNYNGNERDAANIELIKSYDSPSILSVLLDNPDTE